MHIVGVCDSEKNHGYICLLQLCAWIAVGPMHIYLASIGEEHFLMFDCRDLVGANEFNTLPI
jgi:hypothetical protein